ncbi:hypothetical protein BGW38_006059 [Lunasporangiospora selenospora]|uniref:NRDE-2, necessary for RNA interference-domain-containing protein n=1 Tax=Lunasporangiospora selenospora TaxID=979761 RepID=A0A9P6G0F9_9FUNG|nr:hypothetical protein BGW38_006059 [Lunasporangiospora selenospora]
MKIAGTGRQSKSVRYSDARATWRDRNYEYKRISRAKAEELARSRGVHPNEPDYISLDFRSFAERQRDRDESGGESDSSEDSDMDSEGRQKTVDYRDIHGKSVHKETDADLMQTTSDQEEEVAESIMDVLRRRRMMLDADLRKDPKQPAKWLEYIAVEDDIDLISGRKSMKATSGWSAGHVEVKASIFERALQSNPMHEQLLLAYIHFCRVSLEPTKVLTKWDEILRSNETQLTCPGLWIEYLDFRQRHFLSFSVKSFLQVIADALQRLRQAARSTWMNIYRQETTDSAAESRSKLVRIEMVIVHVIARTWTFLKQAGFVERAQGILQGQVEFLFNMPPSLMSEPWQVQIGSLEEYWDSELPRFGEKGAKGWAHYVTEEDEVAIENLLETTTLPAPRDEDDERLSALVGEDVDRYHFERWAHVEKELSSICWFPVRTTAKTVSARPSLYNPYFYDGLLIDLGMDIRSTIESNLGLKRFFPPSQTREQAIKRVLSEIESGQLEGDQDPNDRDWSSVWKHPLRIFAQSPDAIFGPLDHDKAMYPWASVANELDSPLSFKQTIQNSFQQIQEVLPISEYHRKNFSIYHLMFETMDTRSASKGQKLAKKYLKSQRMDLEFWNAYALAEKALGRMAEAKKIYTTALSMYPSFPPENQARAPLLFRNYAELEWEQGRDSTALAILLTFAEGSADIITDNKEVPAPSPTRLLKGRQFYSQKVAQLNLGRPRTTPTVGTVKEPNGVKWFEPALDLIVCYAWFEYLTAPAGSEVEAAVKVFETAIQELDFRNPDQEIEVDEVAEAMATRSGLSRRNVTSMSLLLESGLAAIRNTDSIKVVKKKVCIGAEAELVWIHMAKLVHIHSLQALSQSRSGKRGGGGSRGFQPRDLRRIVRSGLERFPNCSILQSLFFWTEAQQRTYGHVRSWVTEAVGGLDHSTRGLSSNSHSIRGSRGAVQGGSPAGLWVFGLFYELWHQEPFNAHMIRTLLESALDSSRSESFSSSPSLWMIYIELELREHAAQALITPQPTTKRKDKDQKKDKKLARNTQPLKVKALLMRALNDCPWCKDLYMLAFEPRFRKLFTNVELEQIYETMLEKEIRVRHELPERKAMETVSDEESEPSDREPEDATSE